MNLAKLQQSVPATLDKINDTQKEIYAGLNRYGRSLDKVPCLRPPCAPSLPPYCPSGLCSYIPPLASPSSLLSLPYSSPPSPLPPLPLPLAPPPPSCSPTDAPPQTFKAASTYSTTDYDALSSQSHFIKRAIAMHLIREGQFATSALFLTEAGPIDIPASLQSEFITLYEILDAMRAHDLDPAINWTRSKAHLLDPRGSNLEFKLCKLRFIHLFNNDWRDALRYARTEFHRFLEKHLVDVQKLMCAFLYLPDGGDYAYLFADPERAWADAANAFTREFCSLLGLAAESPLYIAATAGAIALPTLLKMAAIMKDKKTEWSTVNELPVHSPSFHSLPNTTPTDTPPPQQAEIALPPGYQFHSIFVCPVSKDQTTESNPPMMLPCGHVIAQESLQRLAKGGSTVSLKCPYCPRECSLSQAKRVVI